MSEIGWNDASGFSTDHIYAVGGGMGPYENNDVWRLKDGAWRKCAFPGGDHLTNVHCGDDGQVYICGAGGSVWVGKEDDWQHLTRGATSFARPNKDIASFQGRTFVGGADLWIWEVVDGKLVQPDGPADLQSNSGAIDISADGQYMLTAGGYGAYLYDGTEWTKLWSGLDFGEK